MIPKTEKSNTVAVIPTGFADDSAKSSKKETFWSINKEMLPFKIHFFLFFGAISTVLPFITVFAKTQMGFTATSLSVMYISQQFIFILTKPCIGIFVDHFNKLKFTIIALSVIQAIFFFLLLPIPHVNLSESDNEMHLNQTVDSLKNCTSFSTIDLSNLTTLHKSLIEHSCQDSNCSGTTLSCFQKDQWIQFMKSSNATDVYPHIICNSNASTSEACPSFLDGSIPSTPNTSCVFCHACLNPTIKTNENKSIFSYYQFWLFVVLQIIAAMCSNGLFTLSDTACYETLQKTGSDYGRQRFWGAVSWGLLCPIAGIINDYTGEFLYLWCLMAIMTVLQVINISRLNLVKPQASQNIFKDIKTVFKSREFISFEIGVFMNGVCTGIIWYYLVWFLETIGGSRFLIGLVNAVQCFVGELPFMFYSGLIIKKLGHFNILTLSSVAYFIRFLSYSYIQNPWYTLPVESLHGLTYGVFYATMTSFAKVSSRPGTEATTQAVLCITYEGFGAGLGCVIAGFGFDYFGVHGTFFWMAMLSALTFVINLMNSRRIKPKKTPDVKATFVT